MGSILIGWQSSILANPRKIVLVVWIYGIVVNFGLAQTHLKPPNGGDGIPGPYYSSFQVTWAAVNNAVAYEYVMSDNPLCFSGCPGDTRQQVVPDTVAIEFNLQEDVWYYWITRVIYGEGDTTYWSDISSFLAKKPEDGEIMAKIAPNPSEGKIINVLVDWAINPGAKYLDVEVISVSGVSLIKQRFCENRSFRYEQFALNLPPLSTSLLLYIITVDGNPNNPNNKIIGKVIVR